MTGSPGLVVVGFGAAGAAAAVTARRLGVPVTVLERQPASAHTPSTRMSGGLVMTITDAQAGARYLDACAGGMVSPAVSEAWAKRAVGLRDWLSDVAPALQLAEVGGAEQPALEGASSVVVMQPGSSGERLVATSGAGGALYTALAKAVADSGAEVRWQARARRLRRREDGRIDGVVLDSGEVVPAAAVVLACGGYEFDEELKRNNLRAYPVHFYGNPGNAGDGVRMAQQVGADLWHMNQMIGRAVGHFVLPDGRPMGFIVTIAPPGYVITDRGGRRFADETPQAELRHAFYYRLLEFDPERGEYPRIPCYWFFDERRRAAGPLTAPNLGACGVGLYRWSADNGREIEAGWIHRGATVAEAAAAAGVVDPEQAARSVAEYNAACERGSDPFGRPPSSMTPIDTPPYCCVALWPGGSNTSGGPRRDEHGRVLDVFGEPIGGLFAAGELGQPLGLRYPADGSNLSEAMCFGQITSEWAAGEIAEGPNWVAR